MGEGRQDFGRKAAVIAEFRRTAPDPRSGIMPREGRGTA
jgi:hypothetical protein